MFSANTKMGKYCHLCLGHDYTITFPVCQGTCHHDSRGLFWALLFEPTGSSTKAALKTVCLHGRVSWNLTPSATKDQVITKLGPFFIEYLSTFVAFC